MEPNQAGTVVPNQKWQLRWGHILLALFFIVLIVIAYIVVHQIKTADKTPLATNSHSTTNNKSKSGGSNKTPVASNSSGNSKGAISNNSSSQSKQSSGSTFPSTSTSSGSPSSNSSSSSSSSSSLANTGPGNTIGVVVAAGIGGATLHQLYIRRRARDLSLD